jgi:hypothetical protein
MWMSLWGKGGIARKNARKTTGINVDKITRDSMGFSANFLQLVDRLLIARHESNSPSNNHYKESYKSLWKKAFKTRVRG